jgi:hypothetical protein
MIDTNGIYRLFGKEKGQNLALGAYNGLASFSTFVNGKPVKFPLSVSSIQALKNTCHELLEASPGSTKAFIHNEWDVEAKKFNKSAILILGKDESGIYYMDFQGKGMGEPIRYPILASKGFQIGSEALDDKSRSKLAFEGFCNVVLDKLLPEAIIASRDAERMAQAKTKFGGGGGVKSNSSSIF